MWWCRDGVPSPLTRRNHSAHGLHTTGGPGRGCWLCRITTCYLPRALSCLTLTPQEGNADKLTLERHTAEEQQVGWGGMLCGSVGAKRQGWCAAEAPVVQQVGLCVNGGNRVRCQGG